MAENKQDVEFVDEQMTGIEAQRDNEFGAKGNTLANLETSLNEIDDFDEAEFNSALAVYENMVVLSKRELAQFVRVVEPLTKATVDQYGKSVLISSVSKDMVELKYLNIPYRISVRINNKSQKMISPFCITVSLLKRLITEAYASIVFVQEKGETHFAICDSLLFLETIPLNLKEYEFVQHNQKTKTLDKELGLYNFKKIGSILSCSDRASEKVIVVNQGNCYFNTGVFSAKIQSPFPEELEVLLFKSTVDVLGVLMELAKVEVKYSILQDIIIVECDGLIYGELPISQKIEDHFSPVVARTLKFAADITIINDSLLRLFALVKSLEHLNDIVTLKFDKKEMTLTLHSTDMTKSSDYKFLIADGNLELEGSMKVSADIMKPYLEVTGTDVKYAFNEVGLCMSNEKGNFIIRRTN